MERKQKQDVLALILPEVVPDAGVGLYPSLTKGFIRAAGESHCQVLTCNCDTLTDVRAQSDIILQLLSKKNVGGVGIVPTVTPMPAYQLDVLTSHGIPVVFCHRRPSGLNAPLITWAWEEVGRRAGEAIVGHGHRRVAFMGTGRYEVTNAYLDGLRKVLAKNGLELPDHRVLHDDRLRTPPADNNSVHRLLVQMLEAPDRPTAFFCNDAVPGESVFLEATRLGLHMPADLSIVIFGCARRGGVLSQRLTAVTIDEVDLGYRAALLIEQMRTGQKPLGSDECILVPLGFSAGETLGSAPEVPLPAARTSAA